MNLLTDYHQGKRKSSCNCHEVTHKLSSKQDYSVSEGSQNRPTAHAIKSLTSYQANRTRVGVKAVRTDLAAPVMRLLTSCQANKARVRVKIVRTDPAVPAMKSLTRCQANRTRVGVRTVRRDPAGPGMKSLTNYWANSPAVVIMVREHSLSYSCKLNHLFLSIL